MKKYSFEVFNNFQCPQNIDPLLLLQLCVYDYTDIRPAAFNEIEESNHIYTESIITNNNGELVYNNRPKIL